MSPSLPLRSLQWLTPKILARVPGGPPDRPGRSPLDPVLRGLLSLEDRTPLGFDTSRGPAHARKNMRTLSTFLGPTTAHALQIRDGHMDLGDRRLAFRHYRAPAVQQPRPTLVYFHGGGFVIGDIPSYDGACRVLAASSGLDVVSVDYRLAPEHRFPAAHDDAAAAFEWVTARAHEFGGDDSEVAVGGDSAGGNLAVFVSRARADRGLPLPAAQLLIYPSLDLTRSCPSHETLGHGYLLDQEMLDFFVNHYLSSEEEARDPRVSPLLHPMVSLPPSLFILAGYDPLIDEGRGYSELMAAEGTHVEAVEHSSLIHGFVNLGGICHAAHDAVVDAGERLAALLARDSAGAQG